MKMILQGWNLMRILRLSLGIVIVVQGIAARETATIVIGVLFGAMALANIGCCGTNGCTIDQSSANKTQNTGYEELDNKK